MSVLLRLPKKSRHVRQNRAFYRPGLTTTQKITYVVLLDSFFFLMNWLGNSETESLENISRSFWKDGIFYKILFLKFCSEKFLKKLFYLRLIFKPVAKSRMKKWKSMVPSRDEVYILHESWAITNGPLADSWLSR